LGNNSLSGHLPSLSDLPKLAEFCINDNNFSGPLPSNFSKHPQLTIFIAHNNNFDGELSSTIFDLQKLETVIFSGNEKLSGSLPSILDSPALTSFVMEGCNLSGKLPQTIKSNLNFLYLAGNNLKSTIPALPPSIRNVSLANNLLYGKIDDAFFEHLLDLEVFDIRNNNIGGTMPTSLSQLNHLEELRLDLNKLSGALPDDITEWPIYKKLNSTTSILFGNVWTCPLSDEVREHSHDDDHNVYACGDSIFVSAIAVFAGERANERKWLHPPTSTTKKNYNISFGSLGAACLALYFVATYFGPFGNMWVIANSFRRETRYTKISDGHALCNVVHSSLDLAKVLVLTAFALSIGYWNAPSDYDVVPLFYR